ncbi:hypothetical protein BH09BAC3_BH09BAC3_38570 [soil metagenome]
MLVFFTNIFSVLLCSLVKNTNEGAGKPDFYFLHFVVRLCMGFKYSVRSDELHFLTHTIVDWIDVFTRQELSTIIVDSLNYCVDKKGLEIGCWCLMPSHLHMIARMTEGAENNLSSVMRDFKKFTSKEIVKTIPEINESRKEWLLKHFQTLE